AAAPDHNPGTGGVDVDTDPVAGALDLHVGDAGAFQTGGQQSPDRHIFFDVVRVLLVGVPPRLPAGGDAEPEAVGVDLLAHYCEPPFASPEAFLAGAVLAGAFLAAFFADALAG